MKTLEIKVEERKELGKKATKELRKNDFIPCVMYGGSEIVHFTAHENDFRHLIYTPNSYLVKLQMGKKEFLAVMQSIQFHPVTDKTLAIDFYQVIEDKPVTIAVPVRLVGFAEGVKSGGQLQLARRKLKVRGLAKDLPDEIVIDVTPIVLGQSLKVGEVKVDGVEIVEPENRVVLSVKLTRMARSTAGEAGEAVEGEEGAEAETSEGTEAPAEESNE